MRIFDRQEWLRVNRARARIKVFVDKYGIEELRRQAEEEMQGDWVAERDFSIEHRLFDDDERECAPAAPSSYGSPNGDVSEFERFRAANVREQKQEGFVTVEVKVTRGDLTPEQFSGLAAIMRSYAGGYARTTVQQNFVLRWVREECVYDLWRALSELGLGDAGLTRNQRRRLMPRHRLLQARDHQLDGAERGRAGAHRGDGHHRRADAQTEHQDQRLPERLRPAPRRQHRLLRARRSKSASTRSPPTSRIIGGVFEGGDVEFGTRLKLRLPSKRVPEAIERWIRHYEATRNEGEEWNDFAERGRHRRARGACQGPLDARRLRPRDDEPVHRLEPRCTLPGRYAERASARSSRHPAPGGRAPWPARRAAVLLPEGGVGADRRAAARERRAHRRGANRDDRHGRAVRGDAADVAGVRGALRDQGRGRRTPRAPTARGADPSTAARRRRSRRSSARSRTPTAGSPGSAASRARRGRPPS